MTTRFVWMFSSILQTFFVVKDLLRFLFNWTYEDWIKEMALLKRKLTEEERRERNEKYCKKYQNSVKEKQPNVEAECKQY